MTQVLVLVSLHNLSLTSSSAYREAVYLASEAGVKILAQTVIWNSEGSASWDNTLPINLRDSQDLF